MSKEEVKCSYCNKPAHRTGPGGWGICRECDDKLDTADKRILIDVSGGLVQEVFVTPGLDVDIYRIDWDCIKDDGDIASEPWSKWKPVELTHDEFRKKLREAEHEHARYRQCEHCGAPISDHGEGNCPKKLWEDNDRQFPRLLSAIHKYGISDIQRMRLAQRMGVTEDEVDELLKRAHDVSEHNKAKLGLDDDERRNS